MRESASGMVAAEVLPDVTMSRATIALVAPSRLAIASMMRRLAWCGMNPASYSGATPARRHASIAIGAICEVAHR
jgi:hypothetical protein